MKNMKKLSRGKLFLLGIAAVVVVVMLVGVQRIFLPVRVVHPDYRQELVALSQSIMPDTDEARRNAERIVLAYEAIHRIRKEEFASLPQDLRDLVLRIDASAQMDPSILRLETDARAYTEYLPEEYAAAQELVGRVYARYLAEVAPLLDGLAPASEIAPGWEFDENALTLHEILLPGLGHVRMLTRWEVHRLHEAMFDGDASGAAAALERIGGLRRSTDGAPFLVSRLVGHAILSMALTPIHDALSRGQIGGEMATRLLGVLRTIRSTDVGTAYSIDGERLGMQSFIDAIYSGRLGDAEYLDGSVTLRPAMVRLLGSEPRTYRRANRTMEQVRHAFEHDDMDAIVAIEREIESRSWQTWGVSRIPELLLPAFSHILRSERDARTMFEIVETMLAIESHRADHAGPPTSLEALVPDYLSRVPVDPFSPDRATMRYRPLGLNHEDPVELDYLLWSVGPNGTDDGGAFAIGEPVSRPMSMLPGLSALELLREARRNSGTWMTEDIILNMPTERLRQLIEAAQHEASNPD